MRMKAFEPEIDRLSMLVSAAMIHPASGSRDSLLVVIEDPIALEAIEFVRSELLVSGWESSYDSGGQMEKPALKIWPKVGRE